MEKSSFFNSVDGDRLYDASDFAAYFASLLTNGVFPNPSTNLQVRANSDMSVTISQGQAWINGYFYNNDEDLILPVYIANGVLNRIDTVVVRFNKADRVINTMVKTGTPATNPLPPVIQRDADIFELQLASIYVGKGVTAIKDANITDYRLNTSVCGIVNSLIQADTTTIFTQYQNWFALQSNRYDTEMAANEEEFANQFNTWFDGVKNSLSGDVAGNLLTKIEAVPTVYRGAVAPSNPKATDFWFKQV